MNQDKKSPQLPSGRSLLPTAYNFANPNALIEWGPGQGPSLEYIPPNHKRFLPNIPLRVPIVVRFMWDDGSAAGFHNDEEPCFLNPEFATDTGDGSNCNADGADPSSPIGRRLDGTVGLDGEDPLGVYGGGFSPGSTLSYCYYGPECSPLPDGFTWV